MAVADDAGGAPGHRTARAANPLERLERLPVLQRAIVLRELLGPPKALEPGARDPRRRER